MNRELLEEEFPEELVKHRTGGYGKMFDYVEIANVIQRLNDAFDARWSFEITDRIVGENEVIILGKLTAEGVTKTQWGGSQVTKSQKSGALISLADDLKAAASDALKKCASHFGVALSIYGRELPPDAPITNRTNGTITPEQLKTIKAERTQRGMSADEVIALCEQLFKTAEVTSLNGTQATTLIAALKKTEEPAPPTNDIPF